MSELEQKLYDIFDEGKGWGLEPCSYEELDHVLKLMPPPKWLIPNMLTPTRTPTIAKLKDLYILTQLQELINE